MPTSGSWTFGGLIDALSFLHSPSLTSIQVQQRKTQHTFVLLIICATLTTWNAPQLWKHRTRLCCGGQGHSIPWALGWQLCYNYKDSLWVAWISHVRVDVDVISADKAKAVRTLLPSHVVCDKNVILLVVIHPRAPALFNILHRCIRTWASRYTLSK